MSILNSNNFLYKTVDGVKQFFSPLVNASTVVLEDGSRLEKDGKIYADQAVKAENAVNATNAENSAMLGGKDPKYYIQPRNLLDNSDFTNLVNQRGQTSYSSGGYRIDRWRCWLDGITRVDTDSLYVGVDLYQYISDIKSGTKVTFAAKTTDGTISVLQSETINKGDYPDENDELKFVYQNDGLTACVLKANHSFVWAALYEGEYTADNLPPYVPKGYAAELAECQRYYNSGQLMLIKTDLENYPITNYQYPVTMRVNPTLTFGTVLYYSSAQPTGLTAYTHSYNNASCIKLVQLSGAMTTNNMLLDFKASADL